MRTSEALFITPHSRAWGQDGYMTGVGSGASEELAGSDLFRVLNDSRRQSSPSSFFLSFIVDL